MEFFNPVLSYTGKICLNFGVRSIEFGHFALVGETGVGGRFGFSFRAADGEGKVIEPILVNRGFSFFYHVLEHGKVPAAMIEHTVDDDVHSPLMKLGGQGKEILIASKAGVYVEIIYNIIFVIFLRSKNRIQVQAVRPQTLNIVQIF